MDFTAWFESIKPWTDLIQFLAGLGLATVVFSYLKSATERRRWKVFKVLAESWIARELEADRHPRDLSEEEWIIQCESMLYDAGFGPLHIETLLQTAVIAAKGRAAAKVFM